MPNGVDASQRPCKASTSAFPSSTTTNLHNDHRRIRTTTLLLQPPSPVDQNRNLALGGKEIHGEEVPLAITGTLNRRHHPAACRSHHQPLRFAASP